MPVVARVIDKTPRWRSGSPRPAGCACGGVAHARATIAAAVIALVALLDSSTWLEIAVSDGPVGAAPQALGWIATTRSCPTADHTRRLCINEWIGNMPACASRSEPTLPATGRIICEHHKSRQQPEDPISRPGDVPDYQRSHLAIPTPRATFVSSAVPETGRGLLFSPETPTGCHIEVLFLPRPTTARFLATCCRRGLFWLAGSWHLGIGRSGRLQDGHRPPRVTRIVHRLENACIHL